MRDLLLVARRALMFALGLGLMLAALPLASLAQEADSTRVTDAFEVAGDAAGSDSVFEWDVTDGGGHWQVALSGPDDEQLDVRLALDDGTPVDAARAVGGASLRDLALDPGTYELTVGRSPREVLPYTLRASRELDTFDAEPNDTSALALPIVEGADRTGRLAGTGRDVDRFRLSVPAGDASLRDVTLSASLDRDLCLLHADDSRRMCRRAEGGVGLFDLLLEPGDHVFEVTGTTDPDQPYVLRVENRGPRPADREAEPNDDLATRSVFRAAIGVTGRSDRSDPDYHVVTIEGEPQLWQVRATGPQVDELSLVRGAGGVVARSRPAGDGSDAVLDDLILPAGDHTFYVRTYGDDYTVTMTPLGPRDEEAEREPNDDDTRAEAYQIGQRRIGRLPTDEDVDLYRFTLAARDHIRLRLEQPAEADFDLRLNSSGREVLRHRAGAPGEPIDLDLALLPGDYLLRLGAPEPSEGRYTLSTERLDPFELLIDQEPNADAKTAQRAPDSLRIEGDRAAGGVDYDWFELPTLTEPSTVTIAHSDARPGVWLYAGVDATEQLLVERLEDGRFSVADAPANTPLYLRLQAEGPYEASLEAAGWTRSPDPPEPAIDVVIELERDTVAAYWTEGQQVGGTISISNTGSDDLEVALEATTSHYAWVASPGSDAIAVAAGATAMVPIDVHILPDAWAGVPVRLSVSASVPDGGRRTAFAVMHADPGAEAVGSRPAWPVPEELLGGLNVASLALGGETLGLVDPEREQFLFDDLTPAGGGFSKGVELPVDLVVDLAGSTPVPIRGTILNPLAEFTNLDQVPQEIELLLSTDGETWTPALTGELLPLPIDQSFVLDEAMPATQAMLRIHSVYRQRGTRVALGEWKVVAEPGAVPDQMPENIAAPVRGGHVARHSPFAGSWASWQGMLDDETKRQRASFAPGEDEMVIVIGFQEGRAAQITGLRWYDPDGSDAETRLAAVDVEVSLEGPMGPWEHVGRWVLGRGPDGTVAPFDLAAPTWARFVRLGGTTPIETRTSEYPARIEVLERATDDDYRSVLGEWGYTSNRGPYEWSLPRAVDGIELDADAGDELAEATPLEPGRVRVDQVEILEDEDWYRVEIPTGVNTLRFDVAGLPTVGVRLALFDADAQAREMRLTNAPDGLVSYEAIVEPGDYYLRVEQPPFNAVFTFDTSGSMGPFLDFVLEGVREFAADVQPGRELVQVIPVGDVPLLADWTDQPIRLEDAVNNFVPSASARASNVEEGLLAAAQLLGAQDGTRAILTVADAETGSLDLANDVWSAFDSVQPIVYTVHVGASGRAEETRNLMRAWSDSNGGVYAYPTTHAEMSRAFERMSTRLRRPATYSLLATTSSVNRDPAALTVVAPEGQPAALAPGVGVGIILDTSGSMRKGLDGVRRIDIAKASLRQLVQDGLSEGVPVSLRTFGGPGRKAARCDTYLTQPLEPLDRARALKLIKRLKADKKTKTPIAAALRAVEQDLAGVEGSRTIVLITDGNETCGDDPADAIEALRASGIEVNLNIVGFALDDEELKAQMAAWAEAGAGSYFDATSASELSGALALAVAAPFRIYALDSDEPIAGGTVGAGSVQLDPGEYRIEVFTDPIVEFADVVLAGGEVRALTLPSAADDGDDS